MTATDGSKAKNRCTIYRERPAFFLRRKCKISFVRRTGIVLTLKYPSGPKFVHFPQVERLLDKSDNLRIRWSSPAGAFATFQCYRFPDLQEVLQP